MFHEIARKSTDVAADVNHLSDEFDAPPRIGIGALPPKSHKGLAVPQDQVFPAAKISSTRWRVPPPSEGSAKARTCSSSDCASRICRPLPAPIEPVLLRRSQVLRFLLSAEPLDNFTQTDAAKS